MAVTAASFRQTFTAFADVGNYPDSSVEFYISTALLFLAGSSVGADRWGTQLDYGTMLFVAHHLVIDARDNRTALAGGIPGEVKGPSNAKGVDKVSAGYDTKAVTFEDQPFWNQTSFGIRLYNLSRMIGAGGVQLGVQSGGVTPFLGLLN